MARHLERPPTRAELSRALAVNAATKPLNIAVAAAIVVAGVVLDLALPLAAVAAVTYLALCAATYLDGDEAERVGARLRSGRRSDAPPRVDPAGLAPPIGAQLRAALDEEQRIQQAIGGSDLELEDVSGEVDGLVRAMERTAQRAQTLWDYLSGQDPARIQARIAQLEHSGDAAGRPVVQALKEQLAAIAELDVQLDRFYAQMEHIVASLGTMHAQLLRMSVASDTDAQQALAGQARELREEVNALADGMSEVYERADEAQVTPGGPPGPAATSS